MFKAWDITGNHRVIYYCCVPILVVQATSLSLHFLLIKWSKNTYLGAIKV